MKGTIRRLPAPLLAVVLALFSVVDIASRALAPRLQRYRAGRWTGLSALAAWRASALPALAGGASLTEDKHPAEFLLSEAPGTLSRDTVTVTVPATTTYKSGLVVGKITASGKYVAYNNGAADGSEVAAGILYAALENAGGAPADMKGVIVNWGAEVRLAALDWNGQLQAAIDAGLVDLLTKGIKAR